MPVFGLVLFASPETLLTQNALAGQQEVIHRASLEPGPQSLDISSETQQFNPGRAIPAARDLSSPLSHSRCMLADNLFSRMFWTGGIRTFHCDPTRMIT